MQAARAALTRVESSPKSGIVKGKLLDRDKNPHSVCAILKSQNVKLVKRVREIRMPERVKEHPSPHVLWNGVEK